MSLTESTSPIVQDAPAADRAQAVHGGDQAASTAQFISFTIGEEEYGVDIMAVREIKGWTEVTTLPNQPRYVRGVLNLRGVIVPIFDMRCRFGLELTQATAAHVIIIVSVGERIIGLLVDTVSDIITVATEEVRPLPETDRMIDARFLVGLVTHDDHMVALLSLDHLFDPGSIAFGQDETVAI